MRKINLLLIMILTLTSLLTSCSSAHKEVDPTNINDLRAMKDEGTINAQNGVVELSGLRVKALQDTAMGLGAQGGLAAASKEINDRLMRDKWYLESVYNFNGMMLSHGVISPVLEQGDNSLNLADPNTIRVADKTYKIVQQARFATTPPTWREYLWMTYNKPELPAHFLLPRTREESRIWSRAITLGWQKGLEQSVNIFQQNLARLKRDYQGMILYRKLLAQNMISAPFVSRTELGVTGDGTDMRINDQVLRITELPKLQTESKGWRAIVVKNNDQ